MPSLDSVGVLSLSVSVGAMMRLVGIQALELLEVEELDDSEDEDGISIGGWLTELEWMADDGEGTSGLGMIWEDVMVSDESIGNGEGTDIMVEGEGVTYGGEDEDEEGISTGMTLDGATGSLDTETEGIELATGTEAEGVTSTLLTIICEEDEDDASGDSLDSTTGGGCGVVVTTAEDGKLIVFDSTLLGEGCGRILLSVLVSDEMIGCGGFGSSDDMTLSTKELPELIVLS